MEARFNGGAWADIDTTDVDGAFSGTLADQAEGQGSVEVRRKNDATSAASVAYVGVGDIFVIGGQSNAEGYAPICRYTATRR